MKRQQKLIIAFGTLVLVTVGFSTLTFAWINYTKNIAAVQVDSGSLVFSNLSTSTYKYVYPNFFDGTGQDTGITDYFGTGEVKNYANANVTMNTYDPTYLTITSAKSQTGVSSLNTNLVIALSFDLKYSTSVDFVVTVKQNDYTAADSKHLRISPYLRYHVYSSADYAALDTSAYTKDADKHFYGIKKADDAATSHSVFGSGATSLDIYDGTLVSTRPASETNGSFTYYIAVDYEYATTVSGGVTDFFDADHLGNSYTLDGDYTIYIKAVEGAL
jgi:hypothetical protein